MHTQKREAFVEREHLLDFLLWFRIKMTPHSQLHLQAMSLAVNPRYSQVKCEYSLPLITAGVGCIYTTTANNAKPIKAFLRTSLDL